VGLESEGDQAKLEAFGKQLAMHIAAAAPQAVGVDGINPAVVAKERKALAEQARESGKPDNIIDKMVEGRLRKYFQETVLLEQTFVIDNETKVEKAVEAAAKDAGAAIKVVGFVRFALGEGIAREESNFAAEVAAQVSAG
ncbi:MAG: translation elongation factor Ts, partial [Proteobacteria bacterium]|nr:translation elongation factor Ts [Pseudomonadota bacterium]